jgi:ankyrin repeat protein
MRRVSPTARGALAVTAGAVAAAAMLLAPGVRPAAAAGRPDGPPLVEAVRAGDAQRVRALLARKADVNAAEGDGMTALHWAADRGDATVAGLLVRAGASLDAVTRLGQYTPLHVAARKGRAAVAALLLQAGARPDARALSGATALHLAAAAGDTGTVRVLVAAKADPDAREHSWGQTPLMFAAANDRAAAIVALLAAGADPRITSRTVDLSRQVALEQAAIRRRNEVLFSMLPQRVQDSILDAQARTPTPAGRPATPAAATPAPDGRTGADSAAPPPPRVYRAGLESPPTSYLTPTQVQAAIDSGRAFLASGRGADGPAVSDTTDGQVAGYEATVGAMGGLTALHHAVRQGHVAATMALLDGGAPIDQVTATDSTSPLLLAVINGHFDLAMQLVARGADVRRASVHGNTPLYQALNTYWHPKSRFPQPQAVQLQKTTHLELMAALLERGADVNARLKANLWYFAFNNCGNANCGLEYLDNTTPFWRAAYALDVDAMRLLKRYGADHTLPSQRAVAARPRGAPGGDVAALDSATRARLAANRAGGAPAQPALDPAIDSAAKAVPPGIGVYPVHCAAGVGYGNGFAGNSHRHAPDGWMPAMKYLVEELGADVNQRDNNGYTPLHHAAARGDNEMILYLVSKGADVKAVSRRGQTTVDMANGPVQRLRPFPETIALLERLGAKNNNRCVGC